MNKVIKKFKLFFTLFSLALVPASFATFYSGDPMNGMGAMSGQIYTGEQNTDMLNGMPCPQSVSPMQGILGQPQMRQQQNYFQQPGNHLFPNQQVQQGNPFST